jgi:hypothetical protein
MDFKSTLISGTGVWAVEWLGNIESHGKARCTFNHSTDKVDFCCSSARMSGSSQSAGGRRVSPLRDY